VSVIHLYAGVVWCRWFAGLEQPANFHASNAVFRTFQVTVNSSTVWFRIQAVTLRRLLQIVILIYLLTYFLEGGHPCLELRVVMELRLDS